MRRRRTRTTRPLRVPAPTDHAEHGSTASNHRIAQVLARALCKYQLRQVERTDIRAAPRRGPVKITGRIASPSRQRAPITGSSCATYHTRIDEWRYGLALQLVEEVSQTPLVLEDDSGLALLFPHRIRFAFARRDDRAFDGYMDQAPLAIARVLHRHDIDPRDEHGLYRPFGFRERVLREGDAVTAFGAASWDTSRRGFTEESGYRSAPLQLVVAAPPGGWLLVSDDPRTFA